MLRKLSVFIAINLVIVAVASMAPPSLTHPQYERIAVPFEFVETLEAGDRISVILGDSRPECCLQAGSLGYVNLAFAGATPVEGLYMLQELLDKGVIVERLIVSFGPFHIVTQDAFHAFSRNFGLIDKTYIEAVLRDANELEDAQYLNYQWAALETIDEAVPWLPDGLKFRLVRVLSLDELLIAGLRRSLAAISGEKGESEESIRQKLYSAVASDRVNTSVAAPEYGISEARSPVNELYLGKLIDLARSRNISLAYLVMPFNRDVTHPEHDFYQYYFSLLDDGGLAQCRTQPLWWPNEHFVDAEHLNESGVAQLDILLQHGLDYCGN